MPPTVVWKRPKIENTTPTTLYTAHTTPLRWLHIHEIHYHALDYAVHLPALAKKLLRSPP